MKTIKYFLSVFIILSILGCDKDDGPGQATLDIVDFKIVNQDGTSLSPTECINPNQQYAVAIQARINGEGDVQVKRVDFTVNGTPFSVTFQNSGTLTTIIPIVVGQNLVQLVDSGLSDSITLLAPTEFEAVP